MPRYYFNIEDGHTTIDNEGSEHPDLQAARQEALVTSSETLRDGGGPHLSSGQPWRLWVTDRQAGQAKRYSRCGFRQPTATGRPKCLEIARAVGFSRG